MTELAAFRVYAGTAKSVEHLLNATLRNGLHIVLPFARDYDAAGNHQIGKFVPYFDSSFTADVIQEFKSKSKSTIKFFVSIGGRNKDYPFRIPPGQRAVWVRNAIISLKEIVKNYRLDGIDVYYEHVPYEMEFPDVMKEVIWELKSGNESVITSASLTVSDPLVKLYIKLYLAGSASFDHVVYQSHSVTSPVSTFNELVKLFDKLNDFPNAKIFAGHSDVLPSDWEKVPLPIFLGAIPKLLQKGIVSISKWIVTDHKPEAGVSEARVSPTA